MACGSRRLPLSQLQLSAKACYCQPDSRKTMIKQETTRLYGRAKVNRSAKCCNAGARCKQVELARYMHRPATGQTGPGGPARRRGRSSGAGAVGMHGVGGVELSATRPLSGQRAGIALSGSHEQRVATQHT